MLRVLLTNDDGISAPGLLALARLMAPHCDLTVIAPDRPQSASSHRITLHKPLRLTARTDLPELEACKSALECSGSPADCVTLGLQHICRMQPPHLVLSGINAGPNLAEDLIYSGTVAGAVEGAIHGVPAFALSLEDNQRLSFDESARLVLLLLARLLYGKTLLLPPPRFPQTPTNAADWPWPIESEEPTIALPATGTCWPAGLLRTPCFNVNIPDLSWSELRGVRWTSLGHREYRDVVEQQTDPRGKPLYWIWGERITPEQPDDSDIRAVTEGYLAVTPIRADLLNRSDLPLYLSHFPATRIPASES